jgi:hypothetical protein
MAEFDPAAAQAASGASEDARIAGALEQVRSLLVPGESLEAYAVQRRIFALIRRRALVAATSGRLIGMSRGLFGGFQPRDMRWQDLKEVRVDVGILGADLTVVAFKSPDLALAGETTSLAFLGLRKDQAQNVYRICQAQEQAWREKRRVRELEELRAKSGGIHLGPGGSRGPAAAGESEDPALRLEKAREMFDKGLITDSEYESIKAKIVSSL